MEVFDLSKLNKKSKFKIKYRSPTLKINELNKWSGHLKRLQQKIQSVIIGQSEFIELLIITLISNGHLLVIGEPGIGKSRAISALSQAVLLESHTIHLESNFIGFNLVTIDELDKLNSTFRRDLLTAMQERLSIVDEQLLYLDRPFLVISTINPSNEEIKLSKAELDRFMFSFSPPYPTIEEEIEIMSLTNHDEPPKLNKDFLSVSELLNIQRLSSLIEVDSKIKNLIAQIVSFTRLKDNHFTALSPRVSISLVQAIKARAFLYNRKQANIDDLKFVFHKIVQHRLNASNLSESSLQSHNLLDQFLK
ncbi:MAG: hypothetical protein COB02_05770 [Candidatus Cloacimonadota bacterium]|nr:MAG: hypothetical protein COB02_05770 [Candidatus Cloacimonadota bacterium]